MKKWGLPKDEFEDNQNWSHQLYIREARRMVGKYVMTKHDCLKTKQTPKSVGMGSYTIDSHNVQRYITPEGTLQNEGDIGVKPKGAYAISYDSLVPKKSECRNLLVPAALSASHIAYGSIRMEPVFMILGQSAATGAVYAIENNSDVQDVPYSQLKEKLLEDGQILEDHSYSKLLGYVLDDQQAQLKGNWSQGSLNAIHGHSYVHDGNKEKGLASAHFKAKLPKAGQYEVLIHYTQNGNRASNVPVQLHANGKVIEKSMNQKLVNPDGYSMGTYYLSEAEIILSNKNTNGYVVIDAVQFKPHP